eukprot:7972651-Pyramimonas_sp.AAC.1
MCAVTCAPGTLCACPERGAPGAAGPCSMAHVEHVALGAPGEPGTLGPPECLAQLTRVALLAR